MHVIPKPVMRYIERKVSWLEPIADQAPWHAFYAMAIGYAAATLAGLMLLGTVLSHAGAFTPGPQALRLMTLEQCQALSK